MRITVTTVRHQPWAEMDDHSAAHGADNFPAPSGNSLKDVGEDLDLNSVNPAKASLARIEAGPLPHSNNHLGLVSPWVDRHCQRGL